MTSALYGTLRRLAVALTVATAAGETWKLVLLSVAIEAICFANILSVACCATRLNVTCHEVLLKIAGLVT